MVNKGNVSKTPLPKIILAPEETELFKTQSGFDNTKQSFKRKNSRKVKAAQIVHERLKSLEQLDSECNV